MNDSIINRSEKNSAASNLNRQPAEPPALVKSENREVILESQIENISLPPDKLNDLFLEAELTARQKATTELERLKIENQKLQIENQGLELQNQRLKDENLRLTELHDTRKQYVGRLFWLITAWLTVVIALVALSATLKNIFTLADSVLIAFITSTTVSVIALFVIVAKWLFPSAIDKDDK
ncbi:MAG: hypothetical protein M3388_10710 [Acidobacteriota bacterium]|jgi:hypothetical protein|nr:hypothetical protein [Acidobacteriota bacterium]